MGKSGFKMNKQGMKDLEKEVQKNLANGASFSLDCPECRKTYDADIGKNKCPYCGKVTELSLG